MPKLTIQQNIERLGHENDNISLAAVERLRKIGSEAVGLLIKALESGTEKIRYRVIHVFEGIDDPRIFDALVKATKAPFESVSYDAIMAFGYRRDVSAIPLLIDLLESKRDSFSSAAAMSLVAMGPIVIEPLAKILLSNKPGRGYAASIFSSLEASQASDYLWQAIKTEDEFGQRCFLTQDILNSFDGFNEEELIHLLIDSDIRVRASAKCALKEIWVNEGEQGHGSLWGKLRLNKMRGYWFCGGYYTYWFYCHELKLAIIVDDLNDMNELRKNNREALSRESQGYKVLRISEAGITLNPEGILNKIEAAIDDLESAL